MKRCEAKWLFAACLCIGLLPGFALQAQTFEEGYQSYMRNQFPVAELQFRAAVKKAKTKEDRAFIMKFIGICQFMRGDKKSSAASFYEALGSDRNVTIDEEEVLDPGVVSFFNVIKTRWINSPEGAAAGAAGKTAPAAVVQKTAPPPTNITNSSPKAMAPETAPAPKTAVVENKTVTPAPVPVPTDKPKKKKTKESGGRSLSWLHFMPFGLGQFSNESYLLGSAFALGQVYSIYQFTYLSNQISKENDQNRQVAQNPNILQAEKDTFLLQNADYISGLKKDKNSAGTFFLALYVASVAEAVIFAPRTHPAADSSGPETSKKYPRKSINTAWLPTSAGGTYLVSWNMRLD